METTVNEPPSSGPIAFDAGNPDENNREFPD